MAEITRHEDGEWHACDLCGDLMGGYSTDKLGVPDDHVISLGNTDGFFDFQEMKNHTMTVRICNNDCASPADSGEIRDLDTVWSCDHCGELHEDDVDASDCCDIEDDDGESVVATPPTVAAMDETAKVLRELAHKSASEKNPLYSS